MAILHWELQPDVDRPVLVAAFEGWNDAAEAATGARRYLATRARSRRFATLDPEEFYDFTVARPQVRLERGLTRRIEWPTPTFEVGRLGPRDVLSFASIEPSLRWRTFCDEVLSVARELDVELVVTLGALMADVPHTRPVRVTGTAADPSLAEALGMVRSRYEGPTGIVGVLHDALGRAGIPSVSLWATVPHYLSQLPSPRGALALASRTVDLLGVPADLTELEIAAAAYDRQVEAMVESDDDLAEYVSRLEEEADELRQAADAVRERDEGRRPDRLEGEPGPLLEVPGEELAEQVEQFLRQHRND